MSNMIKAYSVRYEDYTKKAIDNHLRRDVDILERRSTRIAPVVEESGFVEGLQAVVVDPIMNDEELAEQSVKIIEDARKEAKNIIDKAKLEAEQIKADALAKAQKKGYEEGQQQSYKEVQDRINELDDSKKQQDKEYQKLIAALEPRMSEIMASLIEKITGILVEDRTDVILYLVEKAFSNMDKADSYIIRTGKDDYEFLSSKKEYLINSIGREIQLYFTEDPSLKKNQCLIETDIKVLDCSLDVQLMNLVTDLKLLSGI